MRRFAFSYFARVLLAFSTLFSFFRLRRADRLLLTKIPRPRERSGYPDNAITEVTSVQRFALFVCGRSFFLLCQGFCLASRGVRATRTLGTSGATRLAFSFSYHGGDHHACDYRRRDYRYYYFGHAHIISFLSGMPVR